MRRFKRREAVGIGAGVTGAVLLGGVGYAASKWGEWFGDVGVQLQWEEIPVGDTEAWPRLSHDPLATNNRETWKQLGVTAIKAADAKGEGVQAVAFAFKGDDVAQVGYMPGGKNFYGTLADNPDKLEVAWRRGHSGDPLIAMGRLIVNGPTGRPLFEAVPTQLLADGTTIDAIKQQYPGVPYLK